MAEDVRERGWKSESVASESESESELDSSTSWSSRSEAVSPGE